MLGQRIEVNTNFVKFVTNQYGVSLEKEHKYCSRKCKDSAVSVYSWDRNSAIMETGRKNITDQIG
ncbi:hypothetical protein GCM10020331_072380 [Ectobacillus funiculus]